MAIRVLPFFCWFMLVVMAFPQSYKPSAKSGNSSLAADFTKASQALAGGKLDLALSLVERGLAENPRSVSGLNLLGVIYDQQDQYGLAVIQFRKALAIDPKSVNTRINLATSLAARKDSVGAEKELREALRLQPANTTARYDFASLLLNENNPKAALQELRQIASPDESARLLMVRAWLGSGAVTEGLSAAGKLSHDFPKDTRLHVSLAVLLASHRQYGKAAYEFELADALAPGNFYILHDLGKAYLMSGQLPKAQERLNQALLLQPDSVNTLYLLAQTAAGMRSEVDALEILVRAHKIAPENTDVIFMMAELSMKQSFFEDAISLLKEGLKIDPKRADLHAALGESYFTVGKTDKAMEEFKALIALDPSPRSYVFMGLCYLHLGQYDLAKSYFMRSLSQAPNNLPALYNLGVIARRQQDPEKAQQYLSKAVRLDGDYPEALFELGSLKLDERKFADAIPLFRHFVEVSPQSAPGYYKLAMSERGLHDLADANRDLKVFITLSKNPQPLPYPLHHVFDYLERENSMTAEQRNSIDIRQLEAEVKLHPDRPRSFSLLAEALFKAGRNADAMQTLQRLDALSGGDFNTEMNTGILLGRFHQTADAIRYFEAALKINPSSDDAKYDLADAYFQGRNYDAALQQLLQISPDGQKDSSYDGLLGDVYAHLGQYRDASQSLMRAIAAAPDNDEYYASLALAQIRAGHPDDAEDVVRRGLTRIPDSGLLYWTGGILDVIAAKQKEAEISLKRGTELNPSSETFLATLGILYYEEGRFSEAREVLKECEGMFPQSAMRFQRIDAVLDASSSSVHQTPKALSPKARDQVFQLAIVMHDQEQ